MNQISRWWFAGLVLLVMAGCAESVGHKQGAEVIFSDDSEFEKVNIFTLLDPENPTDRDGYLLRGGQDYLKRRDKFNQGLEDNRSGWIAIEEALHRFNGRIAKWEADDKRHARNQVQDRIIAASNQRCADFKRELQKFDSEVNFVMGAITTGLAGAGAIFTGADVARALSGAAGITSGTRAEYNSSFFRNLTIEVVTKGISARQERLLAAIREKQENKSLTDYTVMAAIGEAVEYHGVCTVIVGLEEASESITRAKDVGIQRFDETFRRVLKISDTARRGGKEMALNLKDAAGNEDTEIPLDIEVVLADADGTEVVTVDVLGVPEGQDAGLNSGTNLGGGRWLLTQELLNGLLVSPPADDNTDFELTVTASVTKGDLAEAKTGKVKVVVNPVADEPTLSVDEVFTANEGGTVRLPITATKKVEKEELRVVVAGIRDDVKPSAGKKNTDGTWSLPLQDLPNFALQLPDHIDQDLELTITATEIDGPSQESLEQKTKVVVKPVAAVPNLEAPDQLSGNVAVDIDLSIQASLNDTDGSERLEIKISGLPDHATLSAGTRSDNGTWSLKPEELDRLTVKFTEVGTFMVAVTAVATDGAGDETNTAERPKTIAITVSATT
jgi:hypothetical protein